MALPAANTEISSNGLPIICMPIGRLLLLFPADTDIAGRPARLAGTVSTSFRYISNGSFCFSPIGKATFGVVGVSIKSHFLKAFLKSFEISCLTFKAYK